MKKHTKSLLAMITAVAVAFLGTTTASAMTESELQDKLTKAYTINGATFQLSSSQKKSVEDYLKSNVVSSDDCEIIAGKVDNAIEVIKDSGAKSVEDLKSADKAEFKDQLKTLVTEVNNETSVKATLGKGSITVYNVDGSKFGVFNESIVKPTGSNAYVVLMASSVVLAGTFVIARKLKKIND